MCRGTNNISFSLSLSLKLDWADDITILEPLPPHLKPKLRFMSTPIQSSSRLESCTDRDFRHKRSWNRKGRFLLLLHAKNKNTRTLQKKTHQDVAILFNICCGIWSRRGHDIKELTKSHILPMECCSKQRNMT